MFPYFSAPATVLAVGAHPDDVELGAGGTLLKLKNMGWKVVILVCTDGRLRGDPETRKREQEAAATALRADLFWGGERDQNFRCNDATVRLIEGHIHPHRPKVVMTHWEGDSNPDHVEVAKATIAACRHRSVETLLCFEGPTSRDFKPQLFFVLDGEEIAAKKSLLRLHASQIEKKPPLGRSAFDLLHWAETKAQDRGIENCPNYCEAFHPIFSTIITSFVPEPDATNGLCWVYLDRDKLEAFFSPQRLIELALPRSELLVAGRTLKYWANVTDKTLDQLDQKELTLHLVIASDNSLEYLGDFEREIVKADLEVVRPRLRTLREMRPERFCVYDSEHLILDGIACAQVRFERDGVAGDESIVLQDINATAQASSVEPEVAAKTKATILWSCNRRGSCSRHDATSESSTSTAGTCIACGLKRRTDVLRKKAKRWP